MSHTPLRAALMCACSIAMLSPGSAHSVTHSSPAEGWQWPLDDHHIARGFEPPADTYGPGHRGLDLTGTPGESVSAVAAGTVVFVGEIDAVPIITVSHGAERSTYQPVTSHVEVGQAVDAGQPIGTLLAGHRGCGTTACLHVGRIRGEEYLDPAALLSGGGSGGRYRLISPDGPIPSPPRIGDGTLTMPVDGSVTSAFGMRIHPISGEHKHHDGIDFGAPCGTAVRAAAAGTVIRVAQAGGYGLRVEIDHGDGVVTSYSHLSSAQVTVGSTVEANNQIARVGTTGTSTGCHLHFSVHNDGVAIDPAPLL